jgi:TBC1 domain family member 13
MLKLLKWGENVFNRDKQSSLDKQNSLKKNKSKNKLSTKDDKNSENENEPKIIPNPDELNVNSSSTSNFFSKYIKTSNVLLQSIITKSEKIHSQSEKSKLRVKDILVSIIKREKESLRKICFEGLPDDLPTLRSLIWKINLSYIGMDVDKWESIITKKRAEYEDIKMAFMMKMEAERKLFHEFQQIKNQKEEKSGELSNQNLNISERLETFESAPAHRDKTVLNTHTLNKINLQLKNGNVGLPSEKELKIYIKYTDKNLLEEIDKDVRRTHTDLNFFFMPSKIEDLKKLTNKEISEVVDKRRSNDVKTIDEIYLSANPYSKEKFETHGDVICRILYIYAKLNPDINYVQGMNELIAPIYYCYSFNQYDQEVNLTLNTLNTSNTFNTSNLESDTFWTFSHLMDDIKVLFMRNKDDTREGIFKKIELLEQILQIYDKEIYNHLKKHGVELSHFAFKWFILFFTQDFILPDVMRLWDAIFSIKDRFFYLFLISLSVMKLKKQAILKCDFAGIILQLQNLEDLDIESILSEVWKIKKEYEKKIKKIIEKAKRK